MRRCPLARKNQILPENVYFYTPKPDWVLPLLNKLPVFFVYNYFAYQHWQRLAYQLALALHKELEFALVHHVNGTGFREPGYTWKMDIPYIWGPTGGTQNFPASFLGGVSWKESVKERIRSFANHVSLHSKPRVHMAAKKAAVIFAANSTNQRDFEASFRRPVELLLETGLDRVRPLAAAKYDDDAPLKILWVGELATRKALPLLLKALARIKNGTAFELRVVGTGPRSEDWKDMARELGIADRCTFRGRLSLADSIAEQSWAHVFAFTSLRDTSGNVMLEALAAGNPVVCFDHQGAADIITAECGYKLPVVNPETAVRDFAETIKELAQDRQKLRLLSLGAHARAQCFRWDANGDRMNQLYWELAALGNQATSAELTGRRVLA